MTIKIFFQFLYIYICLIYSDCLLFIVVVFIPVLNPTKIPWSHLEQYGDASILQKNNNNDASCMLLILFMKLL